ncbi:tyrosine-type recombinase/integrase [Ruegeria atlantica]|uniref:Site-specific recombinase XerD n=1 Tax=Ruegeria atlantica TaxID=81569 RepID=A0A0P1EBU4_9RHOB|nr:integrase family protein [Ruegeria atlantica]CUH46453.1 Site-specific recombinase XerD [Ruegeria atlantica]
MAITRSDIEETRATAVRSNRKITLRDVDGSGSRDLPVRGLTLIVGPTGDGRWVYAYRKRGKDNKGKRHPQKWVRIGGVEETPIDTARKEVRLLKEMVASGRDPLAEKEVAEREEAARRAEEALMNLSLVDAIERYLAQKTCRPSSLASERMQLILSARDIGIEDARINSITKRHVMDLIDQHRSKPATARQRYGALNRLYKWLLARDMVTSNPCAHIDRLPAPPPPRTWKPSALELQALWQAADAIGGTRGRFLKAMILLPLRLSEMAGLEPCEVSCGQVTLSGKRTKNGDDFSLPIPRAYLCLFDPDTDARVFQLARRGSFNARKGFSGQVRKVSGVERFHFHSLRKLFVSELAEHDIGDPDLADSLLNHRQSETRYGVRAAYLQARRRRRKTEVMEAWANLVAYAVEHGSWPRESETLPENVVWFDHG